MANKKWNNVAIDPNLGGRLLLILVVILILVAAIVLSGPTPGREVLTSSTSTQATFQSPTLPQSAVKTPSPEYTQATGVLLAGITVVLIIVTGTIIHLKRISDDKAKKIPPDIP